MGFQACEKELNITEFKDDYAAYDRELRIEAILDPVAPLKTTVRIDWTILVTDTSIFNGRDDDNDWRSYEDLNGNDRYEFGEPLWDDLGEDGIAGDPDGMIEPDDGEGNGRPDQGEPHIDELDEILPHIHVRDAQVSLYRVDNDVLIADFEWRDSTNFYDYPAYEDPDSTRKERIYYAAYKPIDPLYEPIEYFTEYEFRIQSTTQGLITGITYALPPPVFDLTDMTVINNEVQILSGIQTGLTWSTHPVGTVCWVTVKRLYGADLEDIIISYGDSGLEQDSIGNWLFHDFTRLTTPGHYRWEITVPDPGYGAYFYSSLPMDDKALSNLRDETGNVILGIAGSASYNSQLVRILPD